MHARAQPAAAMARACLSLPTIRQQQSPSPACVGCLLQELGWKREDIVVSTKVFWGGDGPNDKGLSRKHIIEGTRNCLKRLQLDYV